RSSDLAGGRREADADGGTEVQRRGAVLDVQVERNREAGQRSVRGDRERHLQRGRRGEGSGGPEQCNRERNEIRRLFHHVHLTGVASGSSALRMVMYSLSSSS